MIKYVEKVSFIGDAVDIVEVGKLFSEVVGEETCVFPISNISKRTVQKQFLNQTNIYDLVVYSTEEKFNFEDPNADVLIFTILLAPSTAADATVLFVATPIKSVDKKFACWAAVKEYMYFHL